MSSGRGWLAEAAGSAAAGDAPPLRTWIAAGLAFVTFLAASVVSFARQDDPFAAYNGARLAAFAAGESGAGTYRVVALGDSRLKYGTLRQQELSRLARRHGLSDLRFLRIVDNLAGFDSFRSLDEAILASRPDLVLIELDLVLREPTLLSHYDRYRYFLVRWMRHLFGLGPLHPDQHALQYETDCFRDEARDHLWARVSEFERVVRVDPTSRTFEAALAFARRARQAGIDVVLFEVRSSPELRAFYRGTRLDDRAALARLRRASDLPIWPFPEELAGSEHFCDYVHLGEAARARFSEWLIARLAVAARSG